MQHYIIMFLYSYLQVKSVISKVVISKVNLISIVLVSLKHLWGLMYMIWPTHFQQVTNVRPQAREEGFKPEVSQDRFLDDQGPFS